MKHLVNFFILVSVVIGSIAVTLAADTTIIVWQSNLNGWNYTNFDTAASLAFEFGPDTPPFGAGSAAFRHAGPPGENGGALHTRGLDGVYLRDIAALKYSTYQEGADAYLYQPPYVQIFLDLDDDGVVDDGIGFEPSWQNGGRFMVTSLQGSPPLSNVTNVVQNNLDLPPPAGVRANQWWEWDLLIGSWWGRGGALSEGSAPADRLGVFECNQFTGGCVTIDGILQVYPNARIISQQSGANTGGLRLQYGFGGNSDEYVGHVDGLIIGLASGDTVTYDFERGPTSKAECKNGGWVGFFRNQGQCVSFFTSRRP